MTPQRWHAKLARGTPATKCLVSNRSWRVLGPCVCALLYAAMNMVFAANRISELDRDGSHGFEMEPCLVGIDKLIHNDWQRMSAREICCVLGFYARYNRRPRNLVLYKVQKHAEAAIRRELAQGQVRLFQPPLDDDRLRRSCFTSLGLPRDRQTWPQTMPGSQLDSLPHATATCNELVNAACALGMFGVSCPETTAQIAKEALGPLSPMEEVAGGPGSGPRCLDLMEPHDAVTLLWGLAASFQRHGRLAEAVLERVNPELAALSYPTAVLLLWAAAYHEADCDRLAALVFSSPLVQGGHGDRAVLRRLPRATRQQLADAHRMLRRRQAREGAASTTLPALPAELGAGETAGEVVARRRGDDPVTRAYNVLADSLLQKGVPLRRMVPWEALLHGSPATATSKAGPASPAAVAAAESAVSGDDAGFFVPLAIPELRMLIHVCETPIHRVRAPNTTLLRSEQRARRAKPILLDDEATATETLQELRRRASLAAGESGTQGKPPSGSGDGAAAVAGGDWLHQGTIRAAEAAGWTVERVSFREFRLALPTERVARVKAFASRLRGELDRSRTVHGKVPETRALPSIL